MIVLGCSDNCLRFIKLSDSSTPTSSRSGMGNTTLFYQIDDVLELPENIVAFSSNLNEKSHIILIDMLNIFYRIDVEKK